jgi:hypothetical protein
VGHITEDNAHPFQSGHITMVHNGTLHNHEKLTREKYEVDSQGLCAFLVQDKTAQDIRDDVNGAYAMVWRDARKHTLNFFRNYARPLVFAHCDGFLLFASEQCMLEFVVARHKIKVEKYEELAAYTHVVIDMTTHERKDIETTYTITQGSNVIDNVHSNWKRPAQPYKGIVHCDTPASAKAELKKGERLTFMYMDHIGGTSDKDIVLEGCLYSDHPEYANTVVYANTTQAIINNIIERKLACVGYITDISHYNGNLMISMDSVAPSCYADPEFFGHHVKASA